MNRFITLVLAFCLLSPGFAQALERSDIGGEFYTRHTFKVEKRRYRTTNYLKGKVLPINTRMTLLKYNRHVLIFRRHDTGGKLRIDNIRKYSVTDINSIFDRMFSADPTDLDQYPESIANNIRQGIVEPGMTKKQVILALGYPPAHETPSPEVDQWRYWTSRTNTILLHFEGGKVTHISE
ncbi:MAG: DUF2845 domain-containing protein [Gammaproteobacteria bacterium]|nr:DUF2845 domain-containing protein [Gammaproteobacteria bacterium]MDH5799483.1 DUF2845 domain-containing protein [Gammaproteobacteria bacterium]